MNETNETDWVIGNIKHSGFYRVNYDLNNWNLLIKQLNSENYTIIDETSRAQLIDDSFNLGRAEFIDQTIFLDIVNYLQNETVNMPFEAALDGLDFFSRMLDSDYTILSKFKVFF